MINNALFSSKSDDWSTPQDLFDSLDREFHFDLDPCADENNHKCERYFTKADNGLEKSWGWFRVFCNPPYGKDIAKWMRKAYEESQKPGTLVVCLVPARTDTRWFHDWVYRKAEIRFIRGRVKFGGAKNSAPFPSMIVIFKSEDEA